MPASASRRGWVAALRRFAGDTLDAAPAAHCDLCGSVIPPGHRHLLDIDTRRLCCACHACTLLFQARQDGRYRLIPQGGTRLDREQVRISDAQWEALRVPVDIAFFFTSTPQARVVAMYPGPAGATESLLDLDAWDGILAANPALADLQPDVEALLVDRSAGARECYRVPIDRCFALAGALRSCWQGFSGGPEVRETLRAFLDELAAVSAQHRAPPLTHAGAAQ
jgi:hypothetical protein